MKQFYFTFILFISINAFYAQTPGQIYQASTPASPLDPNADGFATSSGAALNTSSLEASQFELPWVPIPQVNAEPVADTDTGANCGPSDIVSDPNIGSGSSYLFISDPDEIPNNGDELMFFRMRIGRQGSGAFGYSFLFDTDFLFGAGVDPNAVAGNPVFELEVILGSGNNNNITIENVDGTTNGTIIATILKSTNAQRSYALYTDAGCNANNDPFFLDFFVPLANLGFTTTSSFRVASATSSSPSSALGGSAADVAGVNDNLVPADDDAFLVAVNANPVADVSVNKNLDTAGSFAVGQSVTYTIDVANAGPNIATNVEVSDTPTNLTITSVSGGGCSSFPCTIASIASGNSVSITVEATINATGAFDNITRVSANEADNDTTNNFDNTGNGGTALEPTFIQNASGNWNDSSNWVSNVIPTFNDDATFAAGVTSTVTQNQAVNNLTTDTGSLVTVQNSLTLNIKENLTNSGDFNGDGYVVFDGSTAQQIIGDGTDAGSFSNIRLNNSAGLTVTENVDLFDILDITTGTFTANAEVTFRCGFDVVNSLDVKTRTAQINEVLGSVVSNNNFVTEQCYPGRRAFRLVSPSATTTRSIRATWQESANAWDNNPVPGYGTHITGLGVQNETIGVNDGQNGFDWQPSGNPSLFVLSNTNTGNWTPINNTDVNTLVAGSPYRLMIRGSRAVNLVTNQSATSNTILRETGNLAVGDVDFSFSGLAENTPILIGNPYQANVDLVALLANSSGIKVNAVAVWYPRLGGLDNINNTSDPSLIGGRGGFISFNPSDVAATTVTYNGQSAGGIDSAPQVNNLLQPMQSVYVLADGSATVEIRFRENQKLVSGMQTQAFSIDDSFKFSLLLFDENSFNEGDTMKDGIVINFSENGQNEMDENDLSKFVNDDENLARIYTAANTLLSVEQRELPVHGETLPLFVNKYRTSDYTFVANLENLPGQTNAFLKDSYTEIMYPLNEGENFINFSVDANTAGSLANNRFEIVFENTTLSNVDFETANIQVYPNPASDVIHISTDSNVTFLEYIELFDLNGRLVKREDVSDKKEVITLNINTVTSGIYILKVNTKDTQFSRKVIIK